MDCTHVHRSGSLIEQQMIGRLNVRTVTTRDVVRRVHGMLRPDALSAEHREPRHQLINSALAAIEDERQMMARYSL